jgi:hypothetical protein
MKPKPQEKTQDAQPGLLHPVVVWMRQTFCRHKFQLGDQTLTGIPEQEKPAPNASYGEWMEYFSSRNKHPSHTQRIKWPCAKCGKVFYEHCGLDVLSKHGEIIPHNAA